MTSVLPTVHLQGEMMFTVGVLPGGYFRDHYLMLREYNRQAGVITQTSQKAGP